MAKDNDNDTPTDAGTDEGGGSRAEQLRREAARAAEAARTRAGEVFHEAQVASNQLVDRVRELIEEGNVRRIIIKRGDKTLLEIPLTVGVGAGAAALVMSPLLAAVGALAALVSEITLVVERDEEGGAKGGGKSGGKGDGSEKTVGRSSGGSSSGGSSSGGSSGGGATA